MTAPHWRGPVEVERPRATTGRCLACGRPALCDRLGWIHVGHDDEVACRARGGGRAPEYLAHATPAPLIVGALAAAALIATGAGILASTWCGLTGGRAALVAAILYTPTLGAIAAGIRWARTH